VNESPWTRPTPLDRAAWLALRALAVLVAVVAALLVAGRLRVVLIPIAVAVLISAPLRPVAQRLERRIGRSGAAIVAVLGLVTLLLGVLALIGNAVASDVDELRAAVQEGADDIEAWLADRGIDAARLQDARAQVGDLGPTIASGAASGALLVGEVLAGALLALILSIFVVRDADAAVEALARRSPPRRAARLRVGAAASWKALRRYLLGAAILGVTEALIIGTTVALVGSPLAVPVAVLTFLAAFVPIVGAIVAGVVAVVAALVGGGFGAAVVVAVVAVIVQQLDGDLLAPLIYGKATQLHPAAVLLAVTGGTAIAGLAGAVLAVPILTVVIAVRRATTDDELVTDVRGSTEAGEHDEIEHDEIEKAAREVAG
jgi:predicted PurR-regulated permease PerM